MFIIPCPSCKSYVNDCQDILALEDSTLIYSPSKRLLIFVYPRLVESFIFHSPDFISRFFKMDETLHVENPSSFLCSAYALLDYRVVHSGVPCPAALGPKNRDNDDNFLARSKNRHSGAEVDTGVETPHQTLGALVC